LRNRRETASHNSLFFNSQVKVKRQRPITLHSKWGDLQERNLWKQRAKPQWIVTTRTLCHLQHPVPAQSRLQRILYPAKSEIFIQPMLLQWRRESSPTRDTVHSLWFWNDDPKITALFVHTQHLNSAGRYRQFRVDSDLEAFSHNPSDDSFASLSVRINAIPNIRINGSSRTESNYCLDGPTR
jgi:hypothetical protein